MRSAVLAIILLAANLPVKVHAIEAGDVTSLSSGGVSDTVLAVSRVAPDTYAIVMQSLAANASEYCERYEELNAATQAGRECIERNVEPNPTRLTVNCRTGTIIVLTGGATGSYRRNGGGPWPSVADPNRIIQGDNLFAQVCKRR